MVQDSSSGTGPDTRNWRERLGIGAQELPKLSDEFREAAPPAVAEQKDVPRTPQPVTNPAPMAPRVPRKAPETTAQPAPAVQASPAVPPPVAAVAAAPSMDRTVAGASRATPKVPDNAMQDALAEKLRAQRAAAERLAEQRVLAARQKAEGKTVPASPPPRSSRPKAPPAPATRPGSAAAPGSRPKFSFADEGRGSALAPPRPALGVERGQPPFLRPSAAGSGAPPSRSLTSYRSGDLGSGSAPRLSGTGFSSTRVAARRSSSVDLFARRPEPRDSSLTDETASSYPGRSVRSSPPDDHDQVFEDETPLRPRPTAVDYQSAYQQGDEFFMEEPRRSSGPWLLLLALLVAAIATGAVVWFYSDTVRNLANGVGGAVSGTESVPVVDAPADPSKVTPEAAAPGDASTPSAQKKQIYDRIVGEQEVLGGQVLPTEETPLPPADVPAAEQVPQPPPAAGAGEIPAPDAADQSTGQGLPEVEPPPPLPLPPPGSGQEGNLAPGAGTQVAAASAPPEQGATAPPEPAAAADIQSSTNTLPPPPETTTDGAALVSGAALATGSSSPSPEVSAAPSPGTSMSTAEAQSGATAPTVMETAPVPTPKKKPIIKKKASEENFENLGSAPVVLVPPSQPPAAEAPVASVVPQAPGDQPTSPAPAKKKTIFNIFDSTEPAAPQDQTQVAAVEKPAAPVEKPAPPKAAESSGGGYTIQLASFRTETEAANEYARLSRAFPAVVGPLKRQVRETSVAGSTRYQLALGPLATRSEAMRVCSELIAGGESDCIVRNP